MFRRAHRLSAPLLCAALALPASVAAETAQSPAAAAPAAGTILVLDGSGSMWGRIDGEPKISIAQRAIGTLIDALPDEAELGLALYGHRREADCADIEMAVPVAAGAREAIRSAVAAVSPRGKTPLSDAVEAAARALDYENAAATVILVSDGRETCERDPCAVGAALEAAGAGFTAHVVGFDVADEADRAQLQCLAENTGGRFIAAADAAELTEALAEVGFAPASAERAITPPDPDAPRLDMVFSATDGETGPRMRAGLLWSLTALPGDTAVVTGFDAADLRIALAPGFYRTAALRVADGATVSAEVEVAEAGPRAVTLALPATRPPARVAAAAEAIAAATIDIDWSGPREPGDVIALAGPGDGAEARLVHAAASGDGPIRLRLPPTPGAYEIRYVRAEGADILARATVVVAAAQARLAVDGPTRAGGEITLDWAGPAYAGDRLLLMAGVGDDAAPIAQVFARGDGPVALPLPAEPGAYELRYLMDHGDVVLARLPLDVEDVAATLEPPVAARVGAPLDVVWTGPAYAGDRIALAAPGSPDAEALATAPAAGDAPARFAALVAPGDYELRYVMERGGRVLARVPLSVEDVTATLNPPETAQVGAEIRVGWTGPDYDGDRITLARAGSPDAESLVAAPATDAGAAVLPAPAEPGDYELRYVMREGGRVLARAPLAVADVDATVEGPELALVGAEIAVAWTGPGYEGDRIALAPVGGSETDPLAFVPASGLAPATLVAPTEPGAYELRYVMGQGGRVLASQTIEVSRTVATLDAPEQAVVGDQIEVAWTGPAEENDHLTVTWVDARDDQQINHAFTGDGAPAMLTMPPQPGDYEIRYVLASERRAIAVRPIRVIDAVVELSAPISVEVGAEVAIDWAGPDARNDHVAIAEAGAPGSKQLGFAYTRDGQTLTLTAPEAPGLYEVRYILDQSKRVMAAIPLQVTQITATLAAPATAVAGGEIEVVWAGPERDGDRVVLAALDAPADASLAAAPASDAGSTRLSVPPEPGAYEIRYLLAPGGEIIGRREVTVEYPPAALSAVGSAPAGAALPVLWSGPDYPGDFIAIAAPDAPGGDGLSRAATSAGAPARLVMPAAPGDYEIRYVMANGGRVVARAQVTVTEVAATLDAPPTAAAGGEIAVAFSGPEYAGDMIALAQAGAADDAFETAAEAFGPAPATLALPATPGAYELRYVMGPGGRVLARAPLAVE